MRLIEFFRAQWADAEESGKWMADAVPSASYRQRRAIEDQPRLRMLQGLAFAVIPVVVVIGLVIYLVIHALT